MWSDRRIRLKPVATSTAGVAAGVTMVRRTKAITLLLGFWLAP